MNGPNRAYSWLVLKSLGYKNVLGYPGSWSEWGNHPDTPVEK
jgi:thiosulfate/3-mercaptopyruvate sulfurtransferase